MEIHTKFANGDVVYGVEKTYATDKALVIGPMTIGQVRVEITDSEGIDGEDTFSNYMPQKCYKEQYMCIETGIGTGSVHPAVMLFKTKEDAVAYANRENMALDEPKAED